MQNKIIFRVLLVLGIVSLATALFASNDDETEYMIKIYLDAITKAFGIMSHEQTQNIAQIITAFMFYGERDFRKLSYILATSYHESRFKLIKEIRAKEGTPLYAIQNKYWHTGFYGRGLPQITHEENYRKLGKRIGVDLVNNPDLALDKVYSSNILVVGMLEGLFTGVSLNNYINKTKEDYYNARKVFNGLDRAQLISDHTTKMNANLEYQIV